METKTCTKCGVPKGITEFHPRKDRPTGVMSWCKECHRAYQRAAKTGASRKRNSKYNTGQQWQSKRFWAWYAANRAKGRARRLGLPYDLTSEYLISIAPDVCPVLGIPLKYSDGTAKRGARSTWEDSPSVDRFIPSEGYVVGNVHVISHKANRIKANASIEEVEAVAKWIKSGLA